MFSPIWCPPKDRNWVYDSVCFSATFRVANVTVKMQNLKKYIYIQKTLGNNISLFIAIKFLSPFKKMLEKYLKIRQYTFIYERN
jgi:hypothetical protein